MQKGYWHIPSIILYILLSIFEKCISPSCIKSLDTNKFVHNIPIYAKWLQGEYSEIGCSSCKMKLDWTHADHLVSNADQFSSAPTFHHGARAIANGFNPSLTPCARLPFNKTERVCALPKKIEILLCNTALNRRQPYSRRRGRRRRRRRDPLEFNKSGTTLCCYWWRSRLCCLTITSAVITAC